MAEDLGVAPSSNGKTADFESANRGSSPRGASISATSVQEFADKHCGGKEARLDLLLDMCGALGLRLAAQAIDARSGETPKSGSTRRAKARSRSDAPKGNP